MNRVSDWMSFYNGIYAMNYRADLVLRVMADDFALNLTIKRSNDDGPVEKNFNPDVPHPRPLRRS